MIKASFLRAGRRAAAAQRRFGRARRQKSRTARVFETTAAMIPAIVCLIHLTLRSANAQPVKTESQPIQVNASHSEPGKAEPPSTSSALPLVVVPEPNSLALVGLGFGALLHFRRAKKVGSSANH